MNTVEFNITPLLKIHNELFDIFVDEINFLELDELKDILFCEKLALEKIGEFFNWYAEVSTLEINSDLTRLYYNNSEIAKFSTNELMLIIKNLMNQKFEVMPTEPKVYSGRFTFNETQSATYWIKPYIFNNNSN